MRTALLAGAVVLVFSPPALAADDADVVVTKWLVLPPVDVVARRTLRPDAVFAKHLADRTSAAPKEGDEITGTLGKPAKWATKDADKDGDVEAENGAWAYASVESPADRVVIAKLEGAGVMWVDGAGFAGDVYRLGDVGVPVALRKGANDVYVAGPRGGFRLTLRTPKIDLFLGRQTFPDLNAGTPWSCQLLNTTTRTLPNPDATKPPLVPLGTGRADFPAQKPEPDTSRGLPVFMGVKLPNGESPCVTCENAGPNEAYRRTFVSMIDGSVQQYALLPPSLSETDKTKIGLVLSLHGASVDCMDQAKAYAPKPDFWIVCPTNRGRYGFDWQDWGRLDAYEVLDDALKLTGVNPRRVYLTGHSMGGHGTWHLAANDPGRFLAIAPSAGWSSFESYGAPKMTTPLAWLWRAADGASRTLDLVENLAQIPTYVLHGEKDDNVPPSEAHLMIDAITKAGGKPESHFETDAGHWWDKDKARPGADCVDWPEIWELFRKTEPTESSPSSIAVTMAGSASRLGTPWIEIEQPIEYGRPSRVSSNRAGDRLELSTENVQRFSFGDDVVLTAPTVIDGNLIDEPVGRFSRNSVGWHADFPHGSSAGIAPRFSEREKRPGRCGPFKHAFTNRFLLVYGTAGDDAEDRELLEKARYDSEVWAYRANGDANLMSDRQFLDGDFKDRNVIVYGNADTNSAWTAVFDDDCPIQAKRGTMTVNGAKHEGVVAAAFVRPRKGSDKALAAAFADTGAAATRLFYAFPVFSSGVGIPDHVVFGPGFLSEFDGDVRAAGWFDYAWRMR